MLKTLLFILLLCFSLEAETEENGKSAVEKLPCIKEGEILTQGQCCKKLKPAMDPLMQPTKSDTSCRGHLAPCKESSECCSGKCQSNGYCSMVLKCYRPQGYGAECTANPLCREGLHCINQKVSDYNNGSCKPLASSCKKTAECCSGKCQKGKCVIFAKCQQCTGIGKKPKKDSPCCPGFYKSLNNRCIPDAPPGFVFHHKFSLERINP